MFTIDHIVLPTSSLDRARRRLSLLGFTVAADAAHPFGTGNTCVFMGDGTYLEPLSVVDAGLYERAIAAGNVFVAEDRHARAVMGDEGFSAIALATKDARSDHERFSRAKLSGGEMLEFSRLVRLPDGSEKLARFRLAFATRGDTDSFGVFTCQRLDPLPADRAALERHENGVSGLAEIVLVSEDAMAACVERLQIMFNGAADSAADSHHVFSASNAVVTLFSTSAFKAEFAADAGFAALPVPRLTGAAIVFRVSDLTVTRAVLAANDVAFMDKGSRIVVAPAPGQGAVFAFEE
ncbi:catechol 2,3-dioxygenase-like lactoylglutathione lyase family enzyme [Neorhizobium huautlense]|uniref:Catechol 2,3-dioxygenase-like lactoylglutathione lyase family enzyme n=1 Tax=Neorhizobium huautlense TaxID=67774 RepID=A0ABT9PU90_9HYPH|nr:VOC family protein [Neorhizobium huautlense]MDP9838043.1 catechol 2,3-dioxygenase-like lactoylglutathione lyase family enzyme [Neorhizobium huautlense]